MRVLLSISAYCSLYIDHLEEKIFEDQINLKTLALSEMNLSDLPDGLFKTLTNLEMISIATNKLTKLDKNLLIKNSNLVHFIPCRFQFD